MNHRIALRSAVADDEHFMSCVYASTREDELSVLGWGEAQTGDFLKMQFEAQSRFFRAEFPGSGYEIVLLNDQPVGRIFVNRRYDEIRIVDIALLSEYRSQGIGTELIEAILREAAEAGKPVHLHAERHNRALRLYLRLGFRPVGDDGVYLAMEWSPPVQDATVPELDSL